MKYENDIRLSMFRVVLALGFIGLVRMRECLIIEEFMRLACEYDVADTRYRRK